MPGLGVLLWDKGAGWKLQNLPPISVDTDFLLHPEDRSRFLRFVTGRSRLPARIFVYPDKLGWVWRGGPKGLWPAFCPPHTHTLICQTPALCPYNSS